RAWRQGIGVSTSLCAAREQRQVSTAGTRACVRVPYHAYEGRRSRRAISQSRRAAPFLRGPDARRRAPDNYGADGKERKSAAFCRRYPDGASHPAPRRAATCAEIRGKHDEWDARCTRDLSGNGFSLRGAGGAAQNFLAHRRLGGKLPSNAARAVGTERLSRGQLPQMSTTISLLVLMVFK